MLLEKLNIFKKKKYEKIDYNCLPKHIGIIMDGNGRWAKKRKLPRSAGHKAGAVVLQNIADFCNRIGIEVLTVYAFSTENWKRPQKEIDYLMELLKQYLKDSKKKLSGKNIRIRVIGNINTLNKEIQELIKETEDYSRKNTGLLLNIAINYGSRSEIINAVKNIAYDVKNGKINIENIDEEIFSSYLYTSHCKDPDIIIRPSGEQRLSNFLLWQCAYSELWYSDILWPDFREKELISAIRDYQNRERRFGGI